MSWAPKSFSPIHDHGSSRCWVLMLEGKLDVENFVCSETTPALVRPPEIRAAERILLEPGELDRRLGPTELHRVGNPDPNGYAFSLQLYAAPLTTYAIVDPVTHVRRIVTAACDLELGFD
jgi:predicted metal-dependent enzyme (double-stranded beta helix superfamily)